MKIKRATVDELPEFCNFCILLSICECKPGVFATPPENCPLQLEIINKAMRLFARSFINAKNELIMIPKFNVYTCLDDVQSERDFKIKLVQWFSRECCCALRYAHEKRLAEYYMVNTRIFNDICETNFSVEDMQIIYQKLGNGCNYCLCEQFVDGGFDIELLRRKKDNETDKM